MIPYVVFSDHVPCILSFYLFSGPYVCMIHWIVVSRQ